MINVFNSKRWIIGCLLVLTSSMAFASTVADKVTVTEPVARETAPGQTNTAIYLTLNNADTKAHQLVNATSPAAKQIQLHRSLQEKDKVAMLRLNDVMLPAQANTKFMPNGLHIMLLGLNQSIKAGEKISLTLIFEDGSYHTLDVVVQNMTQTMDHAEHS